MYDGLSVELWESPAVPESKLMKKARLNTTGNPISASVRYLWDCLHLKIYRLVWTSLENKVCV